jgi:hypothetical protein
MFVPSSTMKRAPIARAVTARNDATSGSLMGWPRSAARASILARRASREGSSASV